VNDIKRAYRTNRSGNPKKRLPLAVFWWHLL